MSASVDWPRGPAHPGLADGAAHLWRADLTLLDNGLVELLSAGERKRAADLISDRDRVRWSRSRGVLRELLGRYLGQDPRSVALAYGPHGKPELADTGGRLFFNLSHSGDLAFYAFTATGPVGLDVQLARQTAGPKIDHVALARRAFGEDAARHLEELGNGRGEEEFLRLWTRFEAELKWRGSGIGASASAPLDPPPVAGKPVAAVDRLASPWIVELDIGPHAAAALALRSLASEQRRWAYA